MSEIKLKKMEKIEFKAESNGNLTDLGVFYYAEITENGKTVYVVVTPQFEVFLCDLNKLIAEKKREALKLRADYLRVYVEDFPLFRFRLPF